MWPGVNILTNRVTRVLAVRSESGQRRLNSLKVAVWNFHPVAGSSLLRSNYGSWLLIRELHGIEPSCSVKASIAFFRCRAATAITAKQGWKVDRRQAEATHHLGDHAGCIADFAVKSGAKHAQARLDPGKFPSVVSTHSFQFYQHDADQDQRLHQRHAVQHAKHGVEDHGVHNAGRDQVGEAIDGAAAAVDRDPERRHLVVEAGRGWHTTRNMAPGRQDVPA